MKNKIPKKSKNDEIKKMLFCFGLGAIIFGTIGVSATTLLYSKDVTYDNSSSGLSSTNLQDALDELYEQASSCPVCDSEGICTVECPSDKPNYVTTSTGYKCSAGFPATDLTKNIVTSGSGLYDDSVESGRYIYRGASPDNYITFNSETWRIMSVESDGTIKIIKDASLGKMAWDTSGNRSQTNYCNYSSSYGCNSWGSSSTMTPTTMAREIGGTAYTLPSNESSLNTYLNGDYYNSLSSTAQSKIVSHTFNVGVVGNYSDTSAISTLVTREKANKWTGKIALMNITDFMRTTTSTICTSLNVGYNYNSACSSNNWMFKSISEWTLSPTSYSDSRNLWTVNSAGIIDNMTAYITYDVRPVVFLSSDITLFGSGTSSDPYIIN